MRTRLRFFAALLALLALSASFAEQVWASTCADPRDDHATVDGRHDAHASTMARDGAEHPAPASQHPRHCPLAAAAAGCTLLALPSSTHGMDLASTLVPHAEVAPLQTLGHPLVVPHFRPPQR